MGTHVVGNLDVGPSPATSNIQYATNHRLYLYVMKAFGNYLILMNRKMKLKLTRQIVIHCHKLVNEQKFPQNKLFSSCRHFMEIIRASVDRI